MSNQESPVWSSVWDNVYAGDDFNEMQEYVRAQISDHDDFKIFHEGHLLTYSHFQPIWDAEGYLHGAEVLFDHYDDVKGFNMGPFFGPNRIPDEYNLMTIIDKQESGLTDKQGEVHMVFLMKQMELVIKFMIDNHFYFTGDEKHKPYISINLTRLDWVHMYPKLDQLIQLTKQRNESFKQILDKHMDIVFEITEYIAFDNLSADLQTKLINNLEDARKKYGVAQDDCITDGILELGLKRLGKGVNQVASKRTAEREYITHYKIDIWQMMPIICSNHGLGGLGWSIDLPEDDKPCVSGASGGDQKFSQVHPYSGQHPITRSQLLQEIFDDINEHKDVHSVVIELSPRFVQPRAKEELRQIVALLSRRYMVSFQGGVTGDRKFDSFKILKELQLKEYTKRLQLPELSRSLSGSPQRLSRSRSLSGSPQRLPRGSSSYVAQSRSRSRSPRSRSQRR